MHPEDQYKIINKKINKEKNLEATFIFIKKLFDVSLFLPIILKGRQQHALWCGGSNMFDKPHSLNCTLHAVTSH